MNYHPDDFLRLLEGVEAEGGAMLPDRCRATKYALRIPDADSELRFRDFFTTGCGQDTRFVLPYKLPKGKLGEKMESRGGGLVTVCAVDDEVGKWPRYAHLIEEDSY